MYNTKPARAAAWNKMELATKFDKHRRAIKLGQHKERLISTQQEIDNSTPRFLKQYKIIHQRHKNYKKREKLLDIQRRKKLNMISPYKRHLNLCKSASHPHLHPSRVPNHTSHGLRPENSNLASSNSNSNAHVNINVILNDSPKQFSNTTSISPSNISVTSLNTINSSSSIPSNSNLSWNGKIRKQYKEKRKGNMRTLKSLHHTHKNKKKNKNKNSNTKLNTSSSSTNSYLQSHRNYPKIVKQRRIQTENQKLKQRLIEIQESTSRGYNNLIQQHRDLHDRMIQNKKRQKRVYCPDIVYTEKYKKLWKEQQEMNKKSKRRRKLKESTSSPYIKDNIKDLSLTISNGSPSTPSHNSNKENALKHDKRDRDKLPSLK